MCPSVPVLDQLCQIVTLGGHFHWSVVGDYLFNGYIVQTIWLVIALAVLAQLFGSLIGLILYFMRRTQFAASRWLANAYIWFFRGTPLLVQIYLVYNSFGYLQLFRPLRAINFFPAIGYSQVQMDSFVAALLALSWNEGAYMAEIVRAGIDSIDPGQLEAARSLGMTYFLAMRRIVLPQAARTIVPPLGNEFNGMLKNTSLASVIALTELLQTAINIGNARFLQLELLVVASFWYLVMTSGWTLIQVWIERKLNVSITDFGPDQGSWTQRLLGFGRKGRVAVAGAGAINVPADRGAR